MKQNSLRLNTLIAIAGVVFFFSCAQKHNGEEEKTQLTNESEHPALSGEQVLDELKSGNQSFQKNITTRNYDHGHFYNYLDQIEASKEKQHPKAFVLTCMDSRVPPEIIFDQGIGQLFIDRVAGNVEDQFILGSMEYAVNVQGVKLIVVLGHTHCGAIHAAFEHIDSTNEDLVPLIERVKQGIVSNDIEPYDVSCKHNVVLTMDHILKGSRAIREKVEHHDVILVGGVYHVENGTVDWYENNKKW